MSGAAPGAYDPVELRRRIAVCFSVGELRALAEALGVGGVPWDRGVDQAAREVVRQCERYAGLPALVAKLHEMRPLVEWPEPAAPPIASELPAARPIPPTQVSEPSPSRGDALSGVPTPGFASAPAAPPPRAWPGTTVPPAPAEPPRGLDPRILVAVAGLMLAAAIIAYFAGRASSPVVAGAAPSPSAASGESAGHAEGAASRAATALRRSFANLARVCELPASAGGNELVLRRVFERCGPAPPPPQRRASASPPAVVPPEPTDTTPAPDRPRTPRGNRPDVPPAAAPARGCMSQCNAAHSVCSAGCGPEPTESRAYDGWQRCQGGCLRDESRCRLSCH